ALREQLSSVRAVTPVAQQSVTAIYANANRTTTAIGSDNSLLVSQDWDLVRGRQFRDDELRSGHAVCIIGNTLLVELFGGGDPIGLRFRVGKVSCEVIGILGAKGQSGFGTDQDDIVIMPLRTVQ